MPYRSLLPLLLLGFVAWSVPGTQSAQLAQVFGLRCQTGQGWCPMNAPAPVGSPCSCPSPRGFVQGVVVQ